MKKTVKRCSNILMAAIVAVTSVSCVKDRLFHTPHPDKGAVVFTADFSRRSAFCPVPAEYRVVVGTEECTAPSGKECCHPVLFDPGECSLMAWTDCDGVTVSSGVARVNAVADGEIDPLPGYLFSTRDDVTVVKDDTVRVALAMAQRTRDFHFEFTLTEGDPELVESVTGRLGGVAAAFDIASQSIIGDAAAIKMVFARSGDKLTADVRLLGIVGKDQTLTLEVAFIDREQRKTAEVNLSKALTSLDEDMHIGLEINGDLATPVEADITATITGWKDVEGDHADAT